MELPILECAVCGQGVHKPCLLNLATIPKIMQILMLTLNVELFKSLYNPLNLPRMFSICHTCQPNTIPNGSDGDNKRIKKPTIGKGAQTLNLIED